MLKKILTLALISLLQTTSFYSQTPSYYHYTSSDGLASSTVFDIIQDKEGFIWFGTLNGLSKFDGKHFTTYTTNDGLNSNVITCLLEGEKGEIYLGNYEKGLNVIKNKIIKNYRSSVDGKNFLTTYMVKHNGKIYSYARAAVIVVTNENAETDSSEYNINPSPIVLFRMVKLSDDNLVVLSSKGLYRFKDRQLLKIDIKGLPDEDFYCLAKRSDGTIFIGARGSLYQVKNNAVVKKFSLDNYKNQLFFEIICDRKDNIWFSVLGKGFFMIPNGSNEIINLGIKMGLEDTQIDRFFEDSEGNMWICTFGKGVYCLNNLYLRNYTDKNGLSNNNIICIEKEKSGKILIGTINGISIFENGVIDRLKDSSGKILSGYINSIKSFGDLVYVCWAPERAESNVVSYKGLMFRLTYSSSFGKTKNNFYAFGGVGNNLRILKEYKSDLKRITQFSVWGDGFFQNRLNAIMGDSKNNIWIGSSAGLCRLSDISGESATLKFKKTFFDNDPVLSSKINSIYCDKKNRVWFTGVKGIANYNLNNDSVYSYSSIMGHELSTPTSVTMDSKSRIWIGTMKGLFLLEENSIKFLDSQAGLPSDEVLSLLFDEEKNILYVGTSNGLSLLDVNAFDNYVRPPLDVKINNVQAGDSAFTNYNNLVFEPDQNNVYINFRVINYSSPGSVKYKYKLNDDEWTETDYDFLNLISLQNGTYNLQIIAKAQNTEWSKPFFLSFRILPRFSETIWFYFGVISIFVFVALYIVTSRLRMRNRKITKELELTERINDLKHQALSAMMNPHFIFNSLNSVQYLINSQRNEEANDYIAMMAKLIRKNLDTAGSGFILLSEEINRLKLYLNLEKLRFQESFSYEINFGTDVNIDSIMIPNMIIQPFVENSLWHGIINSGSKGLLTISFTFEDVDIDSVICRSLIIRVTDNGIGIKEAKKNQKEDHISKGIQIIEERLRLLSSKMELPKPIMFEDLSSRSHNSHGTEVIVSLPPPLYKIISDN